jgi:hypothetical protein
MAEADGDILTLDEVAVFLKTSDSTMNVEGKM